MTSIVGKIVQRVGDTDAPKLQVLACEYDQAECQFALLAVDADGTLYELWALNYRVVGEAL